MIPDELPYYESDGRIKNWERFTPNNIHKYKILSEDLVETSINTPTKTLLYVIKLPFLATRVAYKKEYASYYQSLPDVNIYIKRGKIPFFC